MSDIFNNLYKPDVLSCLADLSNDEVFTPPNIANNMLDLLPQELFENPDTTFLDPFTKSGVFLREIAKRLIKGLENKIPNLEERIDHIFKKQLFGIAITDLTSLLSRRSVYCSKYANGPFSVSKFEDIQGNIRFKHTQHEWVKGKCCFCGATESEYGGKKREGMETHAYEFIHTTKPQEIFNMKFDVIIGNPPYQLNTGGSKSQATPLYNLFVEQALKLKPKYLSMIIPDRWFSGGFGLNDFRNKMLNDTHIKSLFNYPVASDCFPGVDIPGGVCYFLWDANYNGDCKVSIFFNNHVDTLIRPLLEDGCNTFIRYNQAISIIRKIKSFDEKTFDTIVSAQKPFGLPTTFILNSQNMAESLLVYGRNKEIGYVKKSEITQNKDCISKYKVFMSASYGERISDNFFVVGKPFIGEPNTICTETYVFAGPIENEIIASNIISYIKTKFFRILVLLKKPAQHLLHNVYGFVPMQDFSKPWTDEELYAKYNLTQDEIDFIESMIRPME